LDGRLALPPSSCVLFAVSLALALFDALEQFEVVFAEGLDDGLEPDFSIAFDGRVLDECELGKGFH
jgi:hypothetical protein